MADSDFDNLEFPKKQPYEITMWASEKTVKIWEEALKNFAQHNSIKVFPPICTVGVVTGTYSHYQWLIKQLERLNPHVKFKYINKENDFRGRFFNLIINYYSSGWDNQIYDVHYNLCEFCLVRKIDQIYIEEIKEPFKLEFENGKYKPTE